MSDPKEYKHQGPPITKQKALGFLTHCLEQLALDQATMTGAVFHPNGKMEFSISVDVLPMLIQGGRHGRNHQD